MQKKKTKTADHIAISMASNLQISGLTFKPPDNDSNSENENPINMPNQASYTDLVLQQKAELQQQTQLVNQVSIDRAANNDTPKNTITQSEQQRNIMVNNTKIKQLLNHLLNIKNAKQIGELDIMGLKKWKTKQNRHLFEPEFYEECKKIIKASKLARKLSKYEFQKLKNLINITPIENSIKYIFQNFLETKTVESRVYLNKQNPVEIKYFGSVVNLLSACS